MVKARRDQMLPDKTFISPAKLLNICTYNVRTLHEEHFDCFSKELDLINWDIVGLCETKLHGIFIKHVDGNHMLYNSGVPENERRRSGVGFIVKHTIRNCVIDFKAVSDRLATMKLKGKYNNLVIIQCYAPTKRSIR